MTDEKSDLLKTFEGDENNIQASITVLKHFGLFGLYERVSPLYDELLVAVQNHLPNGKFPFIRKSQGGIDLPSYDFNLRLYMTLSAQQQFFLAAGHLFRGHITEVGGHARRAIEGAGIAYLSKTKPEIADYFQSGNTKKQRDSTSTGKILPKDNPLTAPLNDSIEYASKLIHNNYLSFANRLQPDLSTVGSRWTLSAKLYLHEATEHNLAPFVNVALWLLKVMERVARLLAASFDLPDCDWFRDLESFQSEIDRHYAELRNFLLQET
jgi:hypothetical protein